MDTILLSDKYADNLDGVLGCYDRLIVTGDLPELCYAKGMTSYLYRQGIRIFAIPQKSLPNALTACHSERVSP